MSVTIEKQVVNNATPTQVLSALGRMRKAIDAEGFDGSYRVAAQFFDHKEYTFRVEFNGYWVAETGSNGLAEIDKMIAMRMGDQWSADIEEIVNIVNKHRPVNPPNAVNRPIEEFTVVQGSDWVGNRGFGGLKIMVHHDNMPTTDQGWDDRPPEVVEYQNDMSRAAGIARNALHKLVMSSDPEVKACVKTQRESLIGLFGDRAIYVEELPNGYGEHDPYWSLFPWFKVTTGCGPIKIGWRKRVINIDWAESEITARANDLFPNEDVTKGSSYIHAWGYEKAQGYIDKLLDWQDE